MTAEDAKTQNPNTHLHSQIYQHYDTSYKNYRNTDLNYLAFRVAALTHTVTGSEGWLCSLHQITLYHMATCYITTAPMYFRVTKNCRWAILTHVTTDITYMPSSAGGWKFADVSEKPDASVCHVVVTGFWKLQ